MRAPRRTCRPRRGVTLVVVAMSLMVFLGFAALAIDLARMANFRGELKGIADAAAMSAALDLASAQTQTTATTNVSTLVGRNPIDGTNTALVNEVTPVTWNFDSATVAAGTPAWNAANAVRVVTRYPMTWTLSRVFNQGTGRTLVDTSIAALGRRRSHPCLKPFVIPYSALRARLGLSPTNDTTSLTAAQVYALRSVTAPVTYTVLDTVNAANTTSFGWANTRQGTTGSANDVATALLNCVSGTLGTGSTLQARPFFGDSTVVRNASTTLCGGSSNCTSGTRIVIPLYTSGTNTNGVTTTTTSTTPAADQPFLLEVDKPCYNSSTDRTVSKKCDAFTATLQSASTSSPVFITNGGVTYSCTAGPTYVGKNPSKSPYYLDYLYTRCFTTTTTTTGTTRNAASYVIKYVATFVWTARTNTSITGYFTTVNLPPEAAGSWDRVPGPVTSAVIVR